MRNYISTLHQIIFPFLKATVSIAFSQTIAAHSTAFVSLILELWIKASLATVSNESNQDKCLRSLSTPHIVSCRCFGSTVNPFEVASFHGQRSTTTVLDSKSLITRLSTHLKNFCFAHSAQFLSEPLRSSSSVRCSF